MSSAQLKLINAIIDAFEQPITGSRLPESDLVTEEFGIAFGDLLKFHHSLSEDYLDKYRFEAAMVKVLNALGRSAERPGRCHPGHDVTVEGVCWSLKTQGDRNIKAEKLHISKFMELGKGKWEDESDLVGLRDRFLDHLRAYDRIFQLRYFRLSPGPSSSGSHRYELVEIPKMLLHECGYGQFAMMHKSAQKPKPGYCTVTEPDGRVKFRLYFDGGTERKLQIKDLRKDLCVVHGGWEF